MTASLGNVLTPARASSGSVTMRSAMAAEAAVETCRNDRRENDEKEPGCITFLLLSGTRNSVSHYYGEETRKCKSRASARSYAINS